MWVKFFRTASSPEGKALSALLSIAAAATCAPIRVEVVSGAPNQREFDRLRTLFGALEDLEPPQDIWPRLEERRFALARRGIQASLIDLWIALTAQAHNARLWTLDADFSTIAQVVPISLYQPHALSPAT